MPEHHTIPERKRPNQFTITLSRADATDVRDRIKLLRYDGPSEFFQKLLSEARGAKCPVVTGGK